MNSLKFKDSKGKTIRVKANKGKWSNAPRSVYHLAIRNGWTHKRLQYRNTALNTSC